jgi:hypothetical protein
MVAEIKVVGLIKAARAAIVLPILIALLPRVIPSAQAAGFTVFGVFAHMVLTSYDQDRHKRIAQLATLTVSGTALIALGTAASAYLWTAVAASALVGFCVEALARLSRIRINANRVPFLLVLMLAVTSPAPPSAIPARIGGWLLAGSIAFVVVWSTWISLGIPDPSPSTTGAHGTPAVPPQSARPNSRFSRRLHDLIKRYWQYREAPPGWYVQATQVASAIGLAMLATRLLGLGHAFWIVLGTLPLLSTSPGTKVTTFLKQQGGVIGGLLISVALVIALPPSRQAYWTVLPIVTFAAAYASITAGLALAQAAFVVFIVVLLNIIASMGIRAGTLRLEDIAIGAAISLITAAAYSASHRLRDSRLKRHRRGT